jgi:exodeoxyribonuclease VII small subunit
MVKKRLRRVDHVFASRGTSGICRLMSTAADHDIAGLPFEKALQELEQIVSQLERGDVPLEASIDIYERGNRLRAHCEQLLRKAELKVEVITQSADGKAAGTRPLDVG